MRVQHLRGTTREWQEVNLELIPKAGELVVEECEDGTIKCKIGTGFTPFLELPYVDDKVKADLLLEIATTKECFERKVAGLNENFVSELGIIEAGLKEIHTKYQNLTEDCLVRNADIKANLTQRIADTTELLRSEIQVVEDQVHNIQSSSQADVARLEADIASVKKNFDDTSANTTAQLDHIRTELIDKYQADDANLTAIFTKTINDAVEQLEAEIISLESNASNIDTQLQKELSRIDVDLNSAKKDFNTALATTINDFNAKCREIIDDYSIQDVNLKAQLARDIADATEFLTSEISAVEELTQNVQLLLQREAALLRAELETAKGSLSATITELGINFNTKYKELSNDYISRDADLKALFNKNLTDAIYLVETDLTALTESLNTVQADTQKELTRVDTKIETAENSFTSKFTELVNNFTERTDALKKDFVARDADIRATLSQNLAQAVGLLTAEIDLRTNMVQADLHTEAGRLDTKITNIEESLTTNLTNQATNFSNKLSEATSDYISRDANLKALLNSDITELTNTVGQLDTKINSVAANTEALNNKLTTDIVQLESDLEATIESTSTELSKLITTAKREVSLDFDTKLADRAALLSSAITSLDEQINGNTTTDVIPGPQVPTSGKPKSIVEQIVSLQDTSQGLLENIEALRSNTNLNFLDVQTDLDKVNSDVRSADSKLTRKIEELSARVADNKFLAGQEMTLLNTQLSDTNQLISTNTAKINENTRRINNLIAPEESTITLDEEVIDIRVGYNGIDYESAGDAVRAIGHELDDLRASLPSYIPDNAIDGLEYVDNQLYLTSKGVQVGDAVTITGGSGGGGGSVSTVRVSNNLPSASFTVAKGTAAWINFTYTSFENEVATGDGTYRIIINDKVIESLSGTVQHGVAKPINVIEYLRNGLNTVKVICTDQYGSSRSFSYTITQAELRLESTFDNTQIFDDTITFRYKVFGQDVVKTAYVFIDDDPKPLSEKEFKAYVNGAETTLLIPKQKHGRHTIKAYVSAFIGEDQVSSDPLEYEIICIEEGENNAILTSSYKTAEVTQGDLISIPFMVYDPDNSNTNIELITYSKIAGNLIEIGRTIHTADRTLQFWNTRNYPTGTAVFVLSYTYDNYGTQETITKSHEVKVAELDIDIAPEEDSLQLYLTSQGRANSHQDRDTWTFTPKPNGDVKYDTITTTFTNFNWESNGWITDSNGDTCLRLNGDARAVINFKPFQTDFKMNGKTIEFEFAVRDVNNRNAIVIDCFDGTHGFRATPDTAFLKSSGSEVSCRYKDEERVRVAITVEHVGTTSRFVSIYLDGVLSGVQCYTDTDIFSQNNPVAISLGSSFCGLDVYNIRIYDKALSTQAVLSNYIADQTVPSTKLALLTNNDILDEQGNVVYERVKELGQIPIITFTGPMPTYKGDKKKKTTRMKFEDPAHPEMNFDVLLDQIDVQGTSSQFYIRKNWKVKLPEARAHLPGAIPAKVYCIKVDYAEATSTHNTGSANYIETLYNREEVTLPPQKDDPRVRTTIQGFPVIIFEKETEESTPIFSSKGNFNYDKDAENAFGFTEDYKDYGVECWEFCNNTSDPVNFTGEIPADWLEDFEPRYAPKSANFARIEELKEIAKLAANGKGTMTAAQRAELDTLMRNCIANFKEMHDWVLSTATYRLEKGKRVPIVPTALEEPVTYGETTYTEDNEEYRLAKFKYEFENYFNMHYSSMYYVFTFFALMTDQRAKNLFLTRWKDADGVYRWYPYFYDNDTIFGINNEGALVFDYFHEDTDQLGSSNVFNGQNSVLWHNFCICFPQEIADTYSSLRSDKKLTYEKIIDQFVTLGSDKYSEAIYNADADYKYVSMARGHIDHTDANGNQVTGMDASNLYQVRGTGEQHLKYFIDNRLNYCDSKWYAGDYPSNYFFLRIYTPTTNIPSDTTLTDDELIAQYGEEQLRIYKSIKAVPPSSNISITPFSSMYAGIRYKSGTLQSQRLNAGDEYVFTPINPNETFNDTETAIYGASELASLGDLSKLYCGVVNLKGQNTLDSNATQGEVKENKLIELIIGNPDKDYYNDNFREIQVGTCRLLRKIDLRNCSGLGIAGERPQKTLDLSYCPNIEHIYTEGTNLTAVTLPEGGYIKTLHLPKSLDTLVIKKQKNITDFYIEDLDYSNIRTLRIENSNLNTTELLNECLAAAMKAETYPTIRAKLTNIVWGSAEEPLANANFVKSLFPVYDENNKLVSGILGIDDNNIPKADAQISGTCYIETLTGAEYAEIKQHYPDLVIMFGKMESEVTFKYKVDNIEYTHSVPVYGENSQPGVCSEPVLTPAPVWPENAAFEYEHIGWSRKEQTSKGLLDHEDDYKSYLQADALTGITGNRTLYPVFKAHRKSYTVTFKNRTILTGNQVLAEISVPYGSSADYFAAGYSMPTKQDGASPDFYEFTGWNPKPENIVGSLTCYAEFRLLDSIWYTLGASDIGEYLDYNNIEKIGYTLNSDGTIYITKYNNYQNSAVLVPSDIEVGSESYRVTRLGGFANHTELHLIRLPDTLVTLTREAFSKCTNLSEFVLPESLVTMEPLALQSCTKLKEIIIPAKLTDINEGAFAQCTNLKSIIIAQGNTKYIVMADGLFDTQTSTLLHGFTAGGAVSLDSSITRLGQYCFSGLPVTSVKIPDSITVISNSAFQDCSNLAMVQLPLTLKKLDSMCFFRCKNLTNIVLPTGLTDITSFAFRECSLESITIPESVNTIGDNAFGVMNSLNTVTFKAQYDANGNLIVPYIHKNAFAQSGGAEGITFNVPWSEGYDYNYIDKIYDVATGEYTEVKIDPTGWGASNFTINYNYPEEEV